MHNRRKSDSATNGGKKNKRHNSISIPYSSSSSPLSEKVIPAFVGYRPTIDRERSAGEIQNKRNLSHSLKSNSFSRIDYDPRSNSLTPILDQSPINLQNVLLTHSDTQSNPNTPPKAQQRQSTKQRHNKKKLDTA